MNIKGEDSSSAGALNAFNEEGDVYYFSKDSTNLVSLISGGMSDSCFGHRSFPNEYTIEFESTLCLHLKSFLSTDLSLKKTNEQFLTVERSCREIVEAEYDGDVMMSSVFLWLTSSDPLRQTMSC
ncbi:hypothetical protein F511_19382 [Dorcoceras hygrometricum]|uniref:Uncharacterized protein n=1 Tax=Dorcoceras hygrometricum TaxID=472368 RepID=A0A2Z7AHG3_9LAMI|nr:hypothetical protein F511_19382 [Dorcoceras hygrometricum]